jgi:hypothetical protein
MVDFIAGIGGGLVLGLLATTILVLLGVAQARRFTAALDAEDITRLRAVLVGIRRRYSSAPPRRRGG